MRNATRPTGFKRHHSTPMGACVCVCVHRQHLDARVRAMFSLFATMQQACDSIPQRRLERIRRRKKNNRLERSSSRSSPGARWRCIAQIEKQSNGCIGWGRRVWVMMVVTRVALKGEMIKGRTGARLRLHSLAVSRTGTSLN